MNRILKGGFYATGGLIALIALSLGGVYGVSQSHLNQTYDVQPAPLVLPTDAETIDHGRHTAVIRGCVDCHGDNLGGKVFVEDPAFGRLIASNLTAGRGGIGEAYAVEDYDRAIRHGIGPDGKALLFMPSHEFNRMSDEDTAALIAYLRSVPPVDSDFPANRVGPLARALYLKGDLPLLPAELIDHSDLVREAPERGPTAAYGGYLATGCIGCHGNGFSGGAIPGAPPDFPPAANITPHADGLASWTEGGFITAMRTGVRPDGTELRDPYMPWPLYAQMTDDEIRALWAYLQTVEARPYGQR
jgi:mono/diheme cytochrome c family protein